VDELLVNLAKHFNVSAMGNTASFKYEVEMLSKLGAVRKETAAIIAKRIAQNEPMIEEALKTAMLDALEEVEPELRRAATEGLLNDAPMDVEEGIQKQLMAYSRQARSQLNLVNTVMLESTAEAFRKGVYAAVDIVKEMDAAQEILNKQTGKVVTGTSTLQNAVRAAVKAMTDEGITGFVDRAGRKWSAEAYVRMDIKTTCSNAANAAVMTRNEQYGNDIVWPRVNTTARPGCYPWQGQLISMANRELDVPDGNGKMRHVYPVSQTTYGQPAGIWGINCHHGPMNVFIPGFSYVRGDENKKAKAENDRLYALTQEQRRLECQVRYAKRDAAMYDAAGDKAAFEQAALKVKEASTKLKTFVNSHESLVFSNEKVYTYGYNRSVGAKASWVSRKANGSKVREADITIDELSPCLRKANTGEIVDTTVKAIKPTRANFSGWEFDWTKPNRDGFTVFALYAKGDNRIQGMVSMKADPSAKAIKIDVVESAPHNNPHNPINVSNAKEYLGVGGHLFAEAARQSKKLGYDGFVFFQAKTNLIEHYQNELGAILINPRERIMAIDENAAKILIERYYGGAEDE
jgi:hypothetical protein